MVVPQDDLRREIAQCVERHRTESGDTSKWIVERTPLGEGRMSRPSPSDEAPSQYLKSRTSSVSEMLRMPPPEYADQQSIR